MKRFLPFFLVLGLLAQTPSHSVTLFWVDTANPTGTTYNIYRTVGTCLSSSFPTSPLSSAIAVKTYVDSSIAGGTTYCYWATAVSGGSESAPSVPIQAVVPNSFPPQTLTIIIK